MSQQGKQKGNREFQKDLTENMEEILYKKVHKEHS